MTQVVLDASVVAKWFRAQHPHHAQAAVVRDDVARGELSVVVPSLLFLELLNVAARRWRWEPDALRRFAIDVTSLDFEVAEPGLATIAEWVAAGLTAYDADYVALAQEHDAPLITDDELILERAPALTRSLVAYR
jgi:predicted nucleic acid-binding protein